jgi:hypothetical protein
MNLTNLVQELEQQNLLDYFVQSSDFTAFGAVQSLTYLAQTMEPEQRYELESSSVSIPDNNKDDPK